LEHESPRVVRSEGRMTSPLRVKEFHEYMQLRAPGGGSRLVTVEAQLNEWFEELAADEANEYDIRQMLATKLHAGTESILVFYEVAPVSED
jgi:hypothetical protein